jgi:elongation factor G
MPSDIQAQPRVVEMAIEPKSVDGQARLDIALTKLSAEDTSLQVAIDHESGQIILKGTSESHLESKVDKLERDGIKLNVGAPQVAFLERPTRRAEVEYTHRKHVGPMRQFAAVKLVVEPDESGSGYRFESNAADAIPKEYIPGIEKGIESVLAAGVVAGFPVTDIMVELIDGKYHDVDSSPLAFEIASRAAFREALRKAESVLLEPIMKVEVITPAEFAKTAIDDLGLRRGKVEHSGVNAGTATINAIVPLINMFGYGAPLHTISNHRATFKMQFDHYAPAPPQRTPGDDPTFRPAIGLRA